MAEPKYKSSEDLKELLPGFHSPITKHVGGNSAMYLHTLHVWGILGRGYELTESAIWAIEENRPQTAAHMLRGLVETVAIAYYALEQVEQSRDPEDFHARFRALVFGSRNGETDSQSVNILTCIDKAKKMFPDLRKCYDDISEVVHPNAKSIFSSMGPSQDEGEGHARFGIPFYEFKGGDKNMITNLVGECAWGTQHVCGLIMDLVALRTAKVSPNRSEKHT